MSGALTQLSLPTTMEKRLLKRAKQNEDGCLEWTGYIHDGYGYIRARGKRRGVHREMWRLYHGDVPPDKQVQHTCGMKQCINYTHLKLGTSADSNKARGQDSGRSKLTQQQVEEIRDSELTFKEIAERVGVSTSTISRIRSGKTWRE